MPAAAQDPADRLAAQVEAIAAPLVVRFKGSDPQFHILTPLGMNATSFNYSTSPPDDNRICNFQTKTPSRKSRPFA